MRAPGYLFLGSGGSIDLPHLQFLVAAKSALIYSNDSHNAARRVLMSLEERYAIYVEQAKKLGWQIKTFDEWLNS